MRFVVGGCQLLILINELSKESLIKQLQGLTGSLVISVPLEEVPANALRRWLIDKLGGRCITCQETKELVIHHKLGGGSTLRELFGDRGELLRITKEWDNGKYCVACVRCHNLLEPERFRRLAYKKNWVVSRLIERMGREVARRYDGSFGSAARGEKAYAWYAGKIDQAENKYDALKVVKQLYGVI